MFPPDIASAPADVMVALWDEASRPEALALAKRLRSEGLRVDVYPEPDKPGRQFKYASARQYAVVVLAGEDERRAGTVTVKNMRTGSQSTVALAGLVGQVRAELENSNA
jgi:histidyl-tRNA synthetase